MDCRSVSFAERVCDCDEGVQCPNDRNPIFFMRAIYGYPGLFATADVLSRCGAGAPSKLFFANALTALSGEARRHPLFLEGAN